MYFEAGNGAVITYSQTEDSSSGDSIKMIGGEKKEVIVHALNDPTGVWWNQLA